VSDCERQIFISPSEKTRPRLPDKQGSRAVEQSYKNLLRYMPPAARREQPRPGQFAEDSKAARHSTALALKGTHLSLTSSFRLPT
jgi:hypothetical protein